MSSVTKLAGLNHLAFHGGSKEFVDEVTLKLRERGIKILYDNKHPYAGGQFQGAGNGKTVSVNL